MSDNIIPKKDAIDRMRDGLPCETRSWPDLWSPTRWADFDSDNTFRRPPEPRREGRTYWIHECDEGRRVHKVKLPMCPACTEVVHVREVLPDEVCVRKMTETEIRLKANEHLHVNPHAYVATLVVAFTRALGLLKDEDALRGDKP